MAQKSSEANTLLMAALLESNESAVKKALLQGANANFIGPGRAQPLHSAAHNNSVPIIDLLLSHGAEVNAADDEGFTPLMIAALNGYVEVVRRLLKSGANPGETRLHTGETALHLAMNSNSYAIATMLLDLGADVDARTEDQSTALHLAAEFGNEISAEALLKHPCSETGIVKAKNNNGQTPSEVAISYDHQFLAQRLDMWAAPRTPVEKKMIAALLKSDVAELEAALNDGADPNLYTPRGDQPLHAAALRGAVPLIQVLLRQGAKVNSTDSEGYTPLMVAALNGRTEAVEELLANRGDPEFICSEGGETALHLAMANDSGSVVRVLLDNGANVNAQSRDGSCPLHFAAEFNALTSAKELLREPLCQTDIKDKREMTPRLVAIERKHQQFLRLLGGSDDVDSGHHPPQIPAVGSSGFKIITGEIRHPSVDIYKNTSTPRGHVLIINYETFENSPDSRREGSSMDVINLRDLFEKMGYAVQSRKNLSYKETKDTLQEFSQDPALDDVDSVFVCMMSHGEDRVTFFTSDDKPITVNEVHNVFKDSNCPRLKGKPKIFLFNFCRGKTLEKRTKSLFSKNSASSPTSSNPLPSSDAEIITPTKEQAQSHFSSSSSTNPNEQQSMESTSNHDKDETDAPRDMLTLFASTDGIKALRNKEEGTYLVKSLCQIFAMYAHNTHMMDLTSKISNLMERECLTTPATEVYHFVKKFYLNPFEKPKKEMLETSL